MIRRFKPLRRAQHRVLEREKTVRIDGQYMSLSYKSEGDSTFASIIVSKKVSPKAVLRNTVRRRLKEALHETLLAHQASGSIIVCVKPVARSASVAGLSSELRRLVQKIGK